MFYRSSRKKKATLIWMEIPIRFHRLNMGAEKLTYKEMIRQFFPRSPWFVVSLLLLICLGLNVVEVVSTAIKNILWL